MFIRQCTLRCCGQIHSCSLAVVDESPDSGGYNNEVCTCENEGPWSPNVDGCVMEAWAVGNKVPDSADGDGACAHEVCATGDDVLSISITRFMSVTRLEHQSQSSNTCLSVGCIPVLLKALVDSSKLCLPCVAYAQQLTNCIASLMT